MYVLSHYIRAVGVFLFYMYIFSNEIGDRCCVHKGWIGKFICVEILSLSLSYSLSFARKWVALHLNERLKHADYLQTTTRMHGFDFGKKRRRVVFFLNVRAHTHYTRVKRRFFYFVYLFFVVRVLACVCMGVCLEQRDTWRKKLCVWMYIKRLLIPGIYLSFFFMNFLKAKCVSRGRIKFDI